MANRQEGRKGTKYTRVPQQYRQVGSPRAGLNDNKPRPDGRGIR